MMKKLMSLTCTAVICLGITGAVFADSNETEGGVHVFTNNETRDSSGKENVGGGVWEYSSTTIRNNGTGSYLKECKSNFYQKSKRHSSTARVGNAKDYDEVPAKLTSRARVVGKVYETAKAYWSNR
ncbi:TPA: hypothetical protein KQG29_000512 [Clostridioides difficile]|nr:hypothetical protein [Clostridioides difficile]